MDKSYVYGDNPEDIRNLIKQKTDIEKPLISKSPDVKDVESKL